MADIKVWIEKLIFKLIKNEYDIISSKDCNCYKIVNKSIRCPISDNRIMLSDITHLVKKHSTKPDISPFMMSSINVVYINNGMYVEWKECGEMLSIDERMVLVKKSLNEYFVLSNIVNKFIEEFQLEHKKLFVDNSDESWIKGGLLNELIHRNIHKQLSDIVHPGDRRDMLINNLTTVIYQYIKKK